MEKEKAKAILEVGIHAFMSSGVMNEEKRKFLNYVCKSAGVELEIPDSEEKLPPIDEILKVLDTRLDKVETLDIIIHLFISDGIFTAEEKKFIETLYKKLEFPESEFENIVKAIEKGVESEKIWLDTKKRILDS